MGKTANKTAKDAVEKKVQKRSRKHVGMRCSFKFWLRTWHLNKNWKEVREWLMQSSGTGISGSRNCMGKGSASKGNWESPRQGENGRRWSWRLNGGIEHLVRNFILAEWHKHYRDNKQLSGWVKYGLNASNTFSSYCFYVCIDWRWFILYDFGVFHP